jgi:hypothetical protein
VTKTKKLDTYFVMLKRICFGDKTNQLVPVLGGVRRDRLLLFSAGIVRLRIFSAGIIRLRLLIFWAGIVRLLLQPSFVDLSCKTKMVSLKFKKKKKFIFNLLFGLYKAFKQARPGVGNLRPAGRIRPAEHINQAPLSCLSK